MKGLRCTVIALTALLVVYANATWTVDVQLSTANLFPSGVNVSVPVSINFGPFVYAPYSTTVTSLPTVSFGLASAGVIAGDGTTNTAAVFRGQYSIRSSTHFLTGFNFVLQGYVFGLGRIVWSKKVVDADTNTVLYDDTDEFIGAGYPGGSDGSFSEVISVNLGLVQNVLVEESVFLDIDGASAPGQDTAILLTLQQDWVPEPASLLALSMGLGALLLRRRRSK